jgi:hypothetical protein
MVPRAIDANLNDVAGELIVSGRQLRQPIVGIHDATVIALELFAVYVSHPAKRVVRADRAFGIDRLSDVLARTEELWMRIAHLTRLHLAAPQRTENGAARE